MPTQSEFARTPPDLLQVHTCDGQDSKVLVAVANHWPFSAAFAREALGASAGELWACSGARVFYNDYLHCQIVGPFPRRARRRGRSWYSRGTHMGWLWSVGSIKL